MSRSQLDAVRGYLSAIAFLAQKSGIECRPPRPIAAKENEPEDPRENSEGRPKASMKPTKG
jgi:hypothetical protein